MGKCLLMNKDTEILTFTFDEELGVVTEINDVRNIDYVPYSIAINKDSIRKGLNEWLAMN